MLRCTRKLGAPAFAESLPFARSGQVKKRRIWLSLLLAAMGSWAAAEMSIGGPQPERHSLRITIAYNNMLHAPGLANRWGFAAVIEAGEDTVLFDTGGHGPTLLANLRRLDIDPKSIDAVVLSHFHPDHTGGLDDFLACHSRVTVHMPRSFPVTFRRMVERHGAHIQNVSGPNHLLANLHSTGEMGNGIKEQALIIDTARGLAIVTGCAHPGILEIISAARKHLNKEVYLLTGGFHLLDQGGNKLRSTVQAIRNLGIQKVAPSHCTGGMALALFRENWKSDFIEGGCGAIIEIP
jgi:7,8-dihydropterin-6-yl-methyl-4-(beta-D-ribofuranosyl)aminobenzene 5'-phosphate synthase